MNRKELLNQLSGKDLSTVHSLNNKTLLKLLHEENNFGQNVVHEIAIDGSERTLKNFWKITSRFSNSDISAILASRNKESKTFFHLLLFNSRASAIIFFIDTLERLDNNLLKYLLLGCSTIQNEDPLHYLSHNQHEMSDVKKILLVLLRRLPKSLPDILFNQNRQGNCLYNILNKNLIDWLFEQVSIQKPSLLASVCWHRQGNSKIHAINHLISFKRDVFVCLLQHADESALFSIGTYLSAWRDKKLHNTVSTSIIDNSPKVLWRLILKQQISKQNVWLDSLINMNSKRFALFIKDLSIMDTSKFIYLILAENKVRQFSQIFNHLADLNEKDLFELLKSEQSKEILVQKLAITRMSEVAFMQLTHLILKLNPEYLEFIFNQKDKHFQTLGNLIATHWNEGKFNFFIKEFALHRPKVFNRLLHISNTKGWGLLQMAAKYQSGKSLCLLLDKVGANPYIISLANKRLGQGGTLTSVICKNHSPETIDYYLDKLLNLKSTKLDDIMSFNAKKKNNNIAMLEHVSEYRKNLFKEYMSQLSTRDKILLGRFIYHKFCLPSFNNYLNIVIKNYPRILVDLLEVDISQEDRTSRFFNNLMKDSLLDKGRIIGSLLLEDNHIDPWVFKRLKRYESEVTGFIKKLPPHERYQALGKALDKSTSLGCFYKGNKSYIKYKKTKHALKKLLKKAQTSLTKGLSSPLSNKKLSDDGLISLDNERSEISFSR